MSAQFEFPENLSPEQFIAELSRLTKLQEQIKYTATRTYYDSFDWRLYSNRSTLESNQAANKHSKQKNAAVLTLRSLDNDRIIAETSFNKIPAFAKEFHTGPMREALLPALGIRALLPVASFDYDVYRINVINDDEKILLRLTVEAYKQFKHRLRLVCVKGYNKTAAQIGELLTNTLGFTATDRTTLLPALQFEGRKPNDYSSKPTIHLAPDMRSDIAGKYIYSHLLNNLKANENGTIADIDSEFLHDFRVAVRRTRAGLSQIKAILPADRNAYFNDFFSWLGQITGPKRDLDVYLLHFEDYKNALPDALKEDIAPLHDFLLAKQSKARKTLAAKLRSEKYRSMLNEWEQFLKEPSYKYCLEQNAKLTIKELADKRIWKIYKRVLNEGCAITDASADEELHTLRKSCKKLRYLLEFFQSLYPEQSIKRLIKNLKNLQDVLGDFQDLAVQEQHLKLFSEEMMKLNTPTNTLLAMGVLIQNLHERRIRARHNFSAKFDGFRQEKIHSIFKLLFRSDKPPSSGNNAV